MKNTKWSARLLRLKRYLRFSIQYFLLEKPRGLDFTMRDTSLLKESGGIYHGYSKSNEPHIREIFNRISCKGARLLDVGCGKGVVLKEALKFPFAKVAGIEISQELVQIAKKNFKIMGISDRITCIHADAAAFDGYGGYDVFFFFNPFSEEIMQKTVDKIFQSRAAGDDKITVIYHNPRFLSVFEKNAQVLEKTMLHDGMKDYDTCILRLKTCAH